MFFSFDGIDGVGKSTQIRLFCEALRKGAYDVVDCRDPGSTALGDAIREILLDAGDDIRIDRRSEMLLYMAARAQLVDEVIRPALDAGKIVVSDRYLLANVVYQGYAGGLDIETVRAVGRVAIDGISPDCIFLLDMPPEAADQRLRRTLDRMESQGDAYRKLLREGFLAEAAGPDSQIHVIDAARPVEVVRSDIWQIAAPLVGGSAL
jgi:dTMP kinase